MRICPICGDKVLGRIDKIYCSVQCKSIDQYDRRLMNDQFFLQVDKQLKLNRKVLKRFNKSGHTTIRAEVLKEEGFNPKFFTHYWKNDKGQVYLFCYEFGFLKIANGAKEKYLLITWQAYMDKA